MSSVCQSWEELAEPVDELWDSEPPLDFVTWMDTHFYLSGESSSTQGLWTTYPFQRGPSFAMTDLAVAIMIEMKPSQTGATKRNVALIGYEAAHRHRNVIHYDPTADDALDFSINHVASMLRDCQTVSNQLLVPLDRQHSTNTHKRRIFRGATVWCRGAKTANAFQRLTGDTVIVEDLDRCDDNVRGTGKKGEGSVEKLAWNRTKTSQARKLIVNSSPTTAGSSLIGNRIAACSQVFKREVPCPACGEYQELIFSEHEETDYGLKYSTNENLTIEEKAATTYCQCRHCPEQFHYAKLPELDAMGRWVSADYRQRDSDGVFTDHDGNPVTSPREVGYQYSSMLSRSESWADLVIEYLEALEAIKQGNYDAMRVFVNQSLGKPYERPSIDDIEPDELIKRLEDYGCEVPDRVSFITMGVDFQKRYLAYEIVGFGADRESWSIAAGSLLGAIYDQESEVWAQLSELAKTKWIKPCGEVINISLTICDEGHEPHNVRKWCSGDPNRRIAAKGIGTVGHELFRVRGSKPDQTYGIWIYNIGAHQASERLYNLLDAELLSDDYDNILPSPGYCHFPDLPAYSEIDPETGEQVSEFFKQYTADRKVKVKRGGKVVEIFEKLDGLNDEFHDTRKLAICAMEILVTAGKSLVAIIPKPVSETEQVGMKPDFKAFGGNSTHQPNKGGYKAFG